MAADPSRYLPRLADVELKEQLGASAAVLIEGPRACGKTATAREAAASEVFLDADANARQAALLDPATVLKGDMPRLIDEWQVAPDIWKPRPARRRPAARQGQIHPHRFGRADR